MQNDPVLVEKVARAMCRATAEECGDEPCQAIDEEQCNCLNIARIAVREFELASAASQLGKDQVQTEASRHVVPPEDGRVPSGPGFIRRMRALRSSPPSAASIPSRKEAE